MGKKISFISVDSYYSPGLLDGCVMFEHAGKDIAYVDEFDHPYKHEVLVSIREGEALPDSIDVIGLRDLHEVIDKEDCLPDVGLVDYCDEGLGLDLKDVTLREVYRKILEKILK